MKIKNKNFINKIICGDARELLTYLEDDSIDVVLTDPPYFLDKLDNKWNYKKVSDIRNQYVIKSLPAGMKFERKQGIRFYSWYSDIAREIFRVLKPGGFFFSFSSPRLYHRMASAIDDAGFEIRDLFIWLYTQNQPKAMSVNHFIKKMKTSEEEKRKIIERLDGWKTPQVKSCFEPIVMAQKPVEQTYLNNMLKQEVGLINTNIRVGQGMFPANVIATEEINNYINKFFLIPKPNKQEKGEYNDHKTVKPVSLCEYLIRMTAFSDEAIILDPFIGSGTTALAAKKLGKHYIGFDINPSYIEIAQKRLKEFDEITKKTTGTKRNLMQEQIQIEFQTK